MTNAFVYASYESALSIDEAMIPYYGSGCKQRIANKPVRLGYKMWVLAQTRRYVINFEPYQGAKGGRSIKASPKSWGLEETIALSLLEVQPRNLSYNVFFDFFTSFRLLKHLDNNGIWGTGTLNKVNIKNVPVKAPDILQKKSKGYYESVTAHDNSITLVARNDNRAIYMASNTCSSKPQKTVERKFKIYTRTTTCCF